MRILFFIGCIGLLFVFASCKEDLPAYAAPEVKLDGNFTGISRDTITWREAYDKVSPSGAPYRDFYDTGVDLTIALQNLHDETLYGLPGITGSIELWPEGFPQFTSTLQVTSANLKENLIVNPQTGYMTIDPGKYVHFVVRWNYFSDNGKTITEFLSPSGTTGRSGNSYYAFFSGIKYQIRYSIQLFAQVAPVTRTATAEFNYKILKYQKFP